MNPCKECVGHQPEAECKTCNGTQEVTNLLSGETDLCPDCAVPQPTDKREWNINLDLEKLWTKRELMDLFDQLIKDLKG